MLMQRKNNIKKEFLHLKVTSPSTFFLIVTQSSLLTAWLIEINCWKQLQFPVVSGYFGDMLPSICVKYEFVKWTVLTYTVETLITDWITVVIQYWISIYSFVQFQSIIYDFSGTLLFICLSKVNVYWLCQIWLFYQLMLTGVNESII